MRKVNFFFNNKTDILELSSDLMKKKLNFNVRSELFIGKVYVTLKTEGKVFNKALKSSI